MKRQKLRIQQDTQIGLLAVLILSVMVGFNTSKAVAIAGKRVEKHLMSSKVSQAKKSKCVQLVATETFVKSGRKISYMPPQ